MSTRIVVHRKTADHPPKRDEYDDSHSFNVSDQGVLRIFKHHARPFPLLVAAYAVDAWVSVVDEKPNGSSSAGENP